METFIVEETLLTALLDEKVPLPPAIHAAGVNVKARGKASGKTLIESISFDIVAGSFVSVIGMSGCGKSTLIRALANLTPLASGHVLFAGYEVAQLAEELPLAIGYLSQFGAFHEEMTVEESLRTAVALRLPNSIDEKTREHWLRHIISLARLEGLLHQRYGTLSGGQMRRIALAEQLIGDPPFLLLDELTSGLDEFSDRELMFWLRDLAHAHGKTILLVTHATYHLECCDAVLFMHQGRQIAFAPYEKLLRDHGVNCIAELFGLYQAQSFELEHLPQSEIVPTVKTYLAQKLRSASPPAGLEQLPTLLHRQLIIFWRDRTQLWLHLVLLLTFPALVAVFAMKGLPQVRQLTLQLETNIVKTLADQLLYLRESFRASALISGLAMFQVVLLTLIGANNGAREIAKESAVLAKELRSGLSAFAYVAVKMVQVLLLCIVQAFWMAWFVKSICGFPGSLLSQFVILFMTVAAMSSTCLAISSAASSPERASLLAIYLVGFQLPLSGAALALPDWTSTICRPFIAAYWGWSGYLKTLDATRHYDVVKQASRTQIASYEMGILVLSMHIVIAAACAWMFVRRRIVN